MSTKELQASEVIIQDGDMTKRYLSKTQFAEKVGVKPGTLDKLKLPAPDVIIGEGPREVRGWLEKTIDTWDANRPGRGRNWEKDPSKRR